MPKKTYEISGYTFETELGLGRLIKLAKKPIIEEEGSDDMARNCLMPEGISRKGAKIIKGYVYRLTEAGHSLSEEKAKNLSDKVSENMKEVGAKTLISCFSYWDNEEWVMFGVEEFPDIEAVQKHAEFLIKLGWPKYVVSKTILGTSIE